MKYYAVAVPVLEGEILEGKALGIVTTVDEAVAECENAGFAVFLPGNGGDISTYHFGDTPTYRFLNEDEKDMGCIFVTVDASTLAA